MREVKRTALVAQAAGRDVCAGQRHRELSAVPALVHACARRLAQRAGTRGHASGCAAGPLHTEFTTRNTFEHEARIRMQLVKGPFATLDGEWRFEPHRRRRLPRGTHAALRLQQPARRASPSSRCSSHRRLAGGGLRRARPRQPARVSGTVKHCTVAYASPSSSTSGRCSCRMRQTSRPQSAPRASAPRPFGGGHRLGLARGRHLRRRASAPRGVPPTATASRSIGRCAPIRASAAARACSARRALGER